VFLFDSVDAPDCLLVVLRVEAKVEEDDRVCSVEVETDATGLKVRTKKGRGSEETIRTLIGGISREKGK